MCEKHYYYTQRGNQLHEEREVNLCANSHHNRPCRQTQEFRHNQDERRGANLFPPSPPLSDTGYVYSGSEGSSHKRRSGTYYPTGSNVVEIGRRPSQRRRSVVLEDSYRPVTPPTYYSTSPSRGEYSSSPRRPGVHIEISSNTREAPRRSSSHHRGSSSSKSSRAGTVGSYTSSEEERLAKLERDMIKAKEAIRRQQVKTKIERQNEAIASRPAVPPAPRPYRRGSVSVRPPVDQLTDAMKNVRFGNQTAAEMERERRHKERRVQEDLAQRERLRARMERRNSTAVYDDTRYRRQY
ncbi:hypothetical protein PG993_013445 [Apiospora rasikravindrae]|uniref:Uncharacterized protein n=1 Tax=Apiospora rasikravindrae TaxID=990691 RepID=A0ABR1RXU2_9PEZI